MKKTTNKTKKQSNGIGASVFCMLMFLFMAIMLIVSESKYLFSEPRNINDVIAAGEPKQGEYVTVGVTGTIDWYAQTQYKINGIIPAGTKQHCLVWLDDGSFISLTVKGKDNIERIDKVIDATWKYINGETEIIDTPKAVFSGQLTSIGSEVDEYYDEALSMYNITPSDNVKVYYLTIDTTNSKLKTWIYFGICMSLAIVFLICLIVNIRNKKKREAVNTDAGTNEAAYDNSYASR